MTREDIILLHRDITDEPESRIVAANRLLALKGGAPVKSLEQSTALLIAFFQELLNADLYMESALLCWGTELFDPRPKSVQKVWNALLSHNINAFMGASALGKSYNMVAWGLLDWARDPDFTNTKIVSTSAGHAKANTWSTLVDFHKQSVIPLPGIIQDKFIGNDPKNQHAAMGLVAVPSGEDGKGRLQGFHPKPRPKGRHPIFGKLTRVRLLLDEAEGIPGGVWQGVDNMRATGGVKIAAAANPANRHSTFAQKIEPKDGWESVHMETDEEWDSKDGWRVTRLDAAKTENVIHKLSGDQAMYPGLQDYEGYMNLVRRGTNSEAYMTFARGWYPESAAQYNVVQQYLLDLSRGTYTWARTPNHIGSLDPAFEDGGDMPMFTTGLYGQANSFKPIVGDEIIFTTPRWVIEVQQQFQIEKGNTIHMGRDTIQICKDLRITPEWFIMDRTGNATGLYDYLRLAFGNILGVMWGEGATDRKILEEDTDLASEMFPDVVSEMWFAYAEWLEYGYIRHAPILQTGATMGQKVGLFGQLSGRQYRRWSKTMRRVESKADYKANSGGESPDCFIAGTMVKTPCGEQAIESLRAGDEVLTPFGTSKVFCTHRTKAGSLALIESSDGRQLCGKPAHRIITPHGWTRLDKTCIDMTTESVNDRTPWILLNTLFTPVRNTGFKALVDTTNQGTRMRRRDYFIESSGLSDTGLFLKACASIMKMVTGQITQSRICPSWITQRIQKCTTMPPAKRVSGKDFWGWIRRARRHLLGTPRKREGNGTHKTLKDHGRISAQSPMPASIANLSSTELSGSSENSVPMPVGKKLPVAVTTLIKLVWSVAKYFVVASIAKQRPVLALVERQSVTPIDVYNLTLEEDNAYYANGFLVENCADSLIMLPHLVRMRAPVNAAMMPERVRRNDAGMPVWAKNMQRSVVDDISFVADD